MRQIAAAAALFVGWGFFAGCASVPGAIVGAEKVNGSLGVSGPTFGEMQLPVTQCASGEHQVFLGGDFSGQGPVVVRLAIDPLSGPGVRVFDSTAPFGKSFVVRQAECEHFHFSLARSGWQINDVWVLQMTLDIDCSTPEGDAIRATVTSASCW
jgi:hypothetical protein